MASSGRRIIPAFFESGSGNAGRSYDPLVKGVCSSIKGVCSSIFTSKGSSKGSVLPYSHFVKKRACQEKCGLRMGRAIYHVMDRGDRLEAIYREERDGGAIEVGMLKALRRGWCFGSEAFRESILEGLTPIFRGAQGNSRRGISGSRNEQEAERRIAGALKDLGIDQSDLPKLVKGSEEKIAIASAVKKQTLVTNA